MSNPDKAESKKSVIIAVDNEHMGSIADVAERLKDAGVTVDRVMHATGTISGRVEPSKMSGVQRIKGILGLEEGGTSYTQTKP